MLFSRRNLNICRSKFLPVPAPDPDPDPEHNRSAVASCRLPVTSHELPATSCQLPVAGYRLPQAPFPTPFPTPNTTALRLPVAGYQLPVASPKSEIVLPQNRILPLRGHFVECGLHACGDQVVEFLQDPGIVGILRSVVGYGNGVQHADFALGG